MNIASSSGPYSVDCVSLSELPALLPKDAFLFTDKVVAELYPSLVNSANRTLVLPSGEKTKSLTYFGECLNWLAASGATRKSVLVAVGGGVIGDLIGFVASAFMRGVDYVQVPTTLLAQVDSSVGGKVAVDLQEGKNLAGAFHPPKRVFICKEFLLTLPPRQLKNGLAEVLKYGFICRPELLSLSGGEFSTKSDEIVAQCVEIKADIVQRDEFESTGLRATLNFGHTIGHAIEKVLKYRSLLHGEAVGIGMAIESKLGEDLGISEAGVGDAVKTALLGVGLPVTHHVLDRRDELLAAMYRDKKAVNRSLTFSLLSSIGNCKIVGDVPEKAVREVLAHG